MRDAARKFEFERAAALRDKIRALKQRDLGVISTLEAPSALPVVAPATEGQDAAAGVPAALAERKQPQKRHAQ
jgi:excinuclease UvrABC nuclease subunit